MTPITTALPKERSMPAKMGATILPFKRHFNGLPYERLAQELGYAKVKTARDNVALPYHRVAVTNRLLIATGHADKALELMADVDASLLADIPPLTECIHLHNETDAREDMEQARFIRTGTDEELTRWINNLVPSIRADERLLAALVRERDARKAGR